MPLQIYQREIRENAVLLVWSCTESTEELLDKARLTAPQLAHFSAIKLEKRRREWLSTQILLQLAANGRELRTKTNGQPYLFPTGTISISHSGNLAGLAIGTAAIGLDIQNPDPKLEKIQRKFCHPEELAMLSIGNEKLDQLTMIWSAKEAIFKCFGEHVDFANHIRVRPFSPKQDQLIADYNGHHGKTTFYLNHLQLSDCHILLACV
jgi:phosphopantetheinyl transferase